MARILPSLIVALSASAAEACPSFGLNSPYLSDFFCGQFDDIAGPKTRTIIGNEIPSREADGAGLTHPDPEWLDLPIIQESWRSDPAKTLKLIERIRDAGGRPLK